MSRISKAQKLAQKEQQLAIAAQNMDVVQQQYTDMLENDPIYSLEVDPLGQLGMPPQQKEFIRHYINFKNVNTAAELASIDLDTAKQYFISYATQGEIRRINKALYHRQFSEKLITLDQIGGYLSSLLTGENVPIADMPDTNTKLRIIQMLIDLNKFKAESMLNPQQIMSRNIDVEIKTLSVSTIQALLEQSNKTSTKEAEQTAKALHSNESLTPEEAAYLSTLPTNELLKLIEEAPKGDKTHE